MNAVFKLVEPSVPVAPHTYVFHVPKYFTKPEIRAYLSRLYSLRVLRVNTVLYQQRIKNGITKRPAFKKAYVTIHSED
jgi:ribosomal protein L23